MSAEKPDPSEMTKAIALRAALLDQLAFLLDEIEALKAVIGRVPTPVLEARLPTGDPSVKELYGLLATRDADVHLPRLRQMIAEDDPAFDPVDDTALAGRTGWNDHAIDDILTRVQNTRRGLLAFLRALPLDAWTRTGRFGETRRDVYSLAHEIIQRDVDLLRDVGYRLHESRWTGERP